jgi:hypothetical protein
LYYYAGADHRDKYREQQQEPRLITERPIKQRRWRGSCGKCAESKQCREMPEKCCSAAYVPPPLSGDVIKNKKPPA